MKLPRIALLCCAPIVRLVLACAALLIAGGCGPSYRVGQVNGVLVVQGKPANQVRVQFVPDIDAQTTGPTSFGTTDEEGKFTLTLQVPGEDSSRPGAVVGSHRVVLTDLILAASATGRGVPVRLDPDYTSVASTPLKQQVSDGTQTIEIKIP
jgi:hypothetical protein